MCSMPLLVLQCDAFYTFGSMWTDTISFNNTLESRMFSFLSCLIVQKSKRIFICHLLLLDLLSDITFVYTVPCHLDMPFYSFDLALVQLVFC